MAIRRSVNEDVAELEAEAGLEGERAGLGVLERKGRGEERCPDRAVQARICNVASGDDERIDPQYHILL
jgi:hypothetical protein